MPLTPAQEAALNGDEEQWKIEQTKEKIKREFDLLSSLICPICQRTVDLSPMTEPCTKSIFAKQAQCCGLIITIHRS